MNLMDLYATLSLDDSNYNAGIEGAKRKSKGLGVAGMAAAKVIADGFELAAKALWKLGTSAVTVGAEFESSMAKVKTIMDPKELGVTDMEDGILSLSQSMGIAATDIADTVYSVISATGDTAGALGITESAAKLATAGFTDTASAVGVLTTAMNAYHLSADEVMDISDSLITVQNLGVTTVAELSSSMGKAIASGAAYGVDLGNIEASYVALTKAGISTAESTTYMSSMMKELGDSGSSVAKTLKKKTGKSFSELMAEGKSMGDVLEILNDSVKGDSAAFMELWSSAEAGNAASAIAGQGFEEFNGWLKEIENSTGATEKAYATMAATFKQKTNILKQSANVVLTKVFERMAPALNNVVDGLTSFIQNLDFEAIGDTLSGVIEGIQGFLDKIDWSRIGMIATAAFRTIGSAASWAYSKIGEFTKGVIERATPAIDGLRKFFASEQWAGIRSKFGEIWDGIRSAVSNAWDKVSGVVSGAMDSLKSFFNSEEWETIKSTVGDIWDSIRGWISNAWDTVTTTVSDSISAIKGFFSSDQWETIKTNVSQVWTSIRYWIMTAWETVKEKVSGALSSLKEYFSSEEWEKTKSDFVNTWNAIRKAVTDRWPGVITDIQGKTMTLKDYLGSNDFYFALAMWQAGWDSARSAVRRLWDWATKPFKDFAEKVSEWLGIVGTAVDDFKLSVSQKFLIFGVAFQAASMFVSGAVEKMVTGFNNAKETVLTAIRNIKEGVIRGMTAMKEGISTVISKIKGFFDWSKWKIQLPRLPKLTVTWKNAGFGGLFSGISVPEFSWNARAMMNPMILGDAVPFAMSGGQIEAGGEAGEEIVGGKNTIMRMIEDSVANVVGDTLSAQISAVAGLLSEYLPEIAERPIVLDSGAVVSGTVRQMDKALGAIQARKVRYGT